MKKANKKIDYKKIYNLLLIDPVTGFSQIILNDEDSPQKKDLSRRQRFQKSLKNRLRKIRNRWSQYSPLKNRINRKMKFLATNEPTSLDSQTAKKGRRAKNFRRILLRILVICFAAYIGINLYKLVFLQDTLNKLGEKIKELHQPLEEVQEVSEVDKSIFTQRFVKLLAILGMVALITVSLLKTTNIDGQSTDLMSDLPKDSNEPSQSNISSSSPTKAKYQLIGNIVQIGFWIGNLLSTYSQFWCRCYSKLDRIILFEELCKMKYAVLTPRSARYLIPCIFSGRPIEMLYPWFLRVLYEYYDPMLGVFRFIT